MASRWSGRGVTSEVQSWGCKADLRDFGKCREIGSLGFSGSGVEIPRPALPLFATGTW